MLYSPKTGSPRVTAAIALLALIALPRPVLCALQDAQQPDSTAAILSDQKRLVEQYRLLEEKFFSLYQFEQDQNPDRSELLQRAFQQSKEKLTLTQLNSIVTLIQSQQLREAQQNQAQVLDQFEELLALLQSEDRGKRVRDELQRHKEYLEEVERILRVQQGIRGQAEGNIDNQRLANSQDKNAQRTDHLNREIKTNEEPSQGPEDGQTPQGDAPAATPDAEDGASSGQGEANDVPSNPVRDRLKQAEQGMRRAQQKLERAQRDQSIDEMRQAERELAQAKQELEKILRQLREEEIERVLVGLESRFRQMLERQIKVLEETMQLDQTAPSQRSVNFEIACGKLSIEQRSIETEANRALLVLQDEGSSTAVPETVRQMSLDMQQCAERLASANVGEITQEIESDIIQTLETLIEAIEEAQNDLDANDQPTGQSGEPGQKALVDQLAELKLIRGQQQRINRRHERYAQLLQDPNDEIGHTTDSGVRAALSRLRDQQQAIQQITRDIVIGKNQ